MSARLEKLLTKGDKFNWLIDYVKGKDKRELDFQNIEKKFSLYRGTSKVFSLKANGKVYAEESYRKYCPSFYDNPTPTGLDTLLAKVDSIPDFDKYVRDKDGNYNEGWYQSIIGRRYSFETQPNDKLLIFDKELMVHYDNVDIRKNRNDELRKWQEEMITRVKRDTNLKRFSKPTSVSAKLDLVGISKEGELWLIEIKQDANTEGIYNSPFQIGIYYKRICELMNNYYKDLQDAVFKMLKQKERLGLIKPQWELPQTLQKEIKLAVVVGGSNIDQVAKYRFPIIKGVIEKYINNKIYLRTCDADGSLKELKW